MPDAPAPIVDAAPLPPAVTAAYMPHDVPFASDAALWLLPLLLVTTFLLGSIPWGVIVSRGAFHKDIRAEGSGNIGTTNAMRTLGKAGGAAVFLLDFGKGLLAGWLGSLVASVLPSTFAALALALAFAGCTWGHIFSPWLGFKGGKGIAVAAACLWFTFGPVGFFIEIGLFAVVVALSRYVSAGSVAAALACVLLAAFYYAGHPVAMGLIMATALTVVWAHRGNIARLRAGTERRIGAKGEGAGQGASGAGGGRQEAQGPDEAEGAREEAGAARAVTAAGEEAEAGDEAAAVADAPSAEPVGAAPCGASGTQGEADDAASMGPVEAAAAPCGALGEPDGTAAEPPFDDEEAGTGAEGAEAPGSQASRAKAGEERS